MGGRDSPYPPFWGVGPVVYAAGLSIRYFTGSNPVHPAILQDGHGRAVMSSEAWRLVLVKVEKRFDSPIRTH